MLGTYNNNNIISYKEFNLTFWQKVIVFLFAFITVWGSIETYNNDLQTIVLNELFQKGFFHPKFVNAFDLFFVFAIFILVKRSSLGFYRNSSRLQRIFFFWVLVNYILNMLNPNSNPNNPVLGMPLFSNVGEYFFILLIYIFVSVNPLRLLFILKYLFTYIAINLLIRGIYLTIFMLLGKGQSGYFWFNGTVTESDTVLIIAFFQSIFFTLFLIYKRKKLNLLFFVFLSFLLILSYRRTPVMFILLSDFLITITFLWSGLNFRHKTQVLLLFAVLFSILLNPGGIIKSNSSTRLINRYLAVIPGMASNKDREFSDSGHWDQTETTFESFKNDASFWGTGYGSFSKYAIQGQSVSIHNVYVATWIYLGFYQFLFLIFTIIIILFYLIKYLVLIRRKNSIFISNFYLLKLSFLIILIVYLTVMAFNSINFYLDFKMELFWASLLFFVVKVDLNTWYLAQQINLIHEN